MRTEKILAELKVSARVKKIDRHLLRCLTELKPLEGQKIFLVYQKQVGGKVFAEELKGLLNLDSLNFGLLGILEFYKGETTYYKV